MVEYYKDNPNVTVIIDRRDGPDRARPVDPIRDRPGRSGRAKAPVQRQVARVDGFRDAPPVPWRSARDVPGRHLVRALNVPTRPGFSAASALNSGSCRFRPGRGGRPRGYDRRMATATFESLNPSTGEVIETFPRSTAADVDRAVATARAAWEDWRLVPAPERGNILFRFAQLLEQRKPEPLRPDDPRDGQGQGRGGRRRPGSDRHELLHGRRGPAPVRPDDAVGAPRQVHDERPHAGRRRRRDHAVELPDRDPRVEALPGARLRQHRRAEAGRGHAAARAAVRRPAARGRPARGRRADRARLRRGGGRRARPPPRRAGDHVHRLARDRRARHEERGRRAQARPSRARRQERDHRHGRRRRRPRGRRHRLVGVRHRRAALHRGVARDRAARRSTRSCRRSSSRAPRSCASARRGRTTPTSAR